jgi:hypothetical protein
MGKGDSGKITDLKLRWPTPNGLAATQEIKISYWLEFPLLSEPIADALLTWGADKTERTRISVIGALRTHFFPYFKETSNPEVSLADIDRAWLAEFRAWLDKKDIKPATSSHAMFAVRYSDRYAQEHSQVEALHGAEPEAFSTRPGLEEIAKRHLRPWMLQPLTRC